MKVINASGNSSVLGRLVKVNPVQKNSFTLLGSNDQKMLGVITESGISNGRVCEIQTSGDALVFINGQCKQGEVIRAVKTGDSGAKGTAVVARSGQSDYLKVGTALASGYNSLILVALNVEYISAAITPFSPDTDAVDYIDFNTAYTGLPEIARLQWNINDNTLEVGLNADVTLQIGQETLMRVFNQTGSTILNGSVVYIVNAGDSKPHIALANANSYAKSFVAGVTTQDIEHGEQGFVTMTGLVRGLNTHGMTEGLPIWLGTIDGQFTLTRPTAPNMSIFIGYVIYAHNNNGIIVVRPTLVPRMSALSDVYGTPSVNGSSYKWDTGDARFEMRNDWDDLRIVPSAFDYAGTGDPDLIDWQPGGSGTTFKAWAFQSADQAFFTVQLPHGYAQGEDIYCHVHWTPHSRGVTENGRTVFWKLDYSWANISGVFGASANVDMTDACNGVNHEHNMSPDILIQGDNKNISSMLICRIYRDTGDTWVGTTAVQSPVLLEIDFHVPMDTQGSATHSGK